MKYNITRVDMYPYPGGFRLDWSAEKMGFGVLLFLRDAEGLVSVDSEMMSKEFIAAVLAKFLEQCKDTRD